MTETLEGLLSDPDNNKHVKPEVVQELTDSLQRTHLGERGAPATDQGR